MPERVFGLVLAAFAVGVAALLWFRDHDDRTVSRLASSASVDRCSPLGRDSSGGAIGIVSGYAVGLW